MAANYTHQSLRCEAVTQIITHTSWVHVLTVNKAKGPGDSDKLKQQEPPVYVPVVGENDKPEFRPTVSTEAVKKKKLDQTQLATDDFYFDKYKKKSKRY